MSLSASFLAQTITETPGISCGDGCVGAADILVGSSDFMSDSQLLWRFLLATRSIRVMKNTCINEATRAHKSKLQGQIIRPALSLYILRIDPVFCHKSYMNHRLYLKMDFEKHRFLQIFRLFYPIS